MARIDDPPSDRPALPGWTRVADALTLVSATTALIALVHPIRLAAVHLSIRHPARLIAIAITIIAVRHVIVPSPTLVSEVRDLWRRLQTRWPAATTAVPVALSTRVLVLLVGYFAVVSIGYPSGAPPAGAGRWWDLPQRWDAAWYLDIAEHGYRWTDDVTRGQNLAFFPAYPLLVRAVSRVVHVPGTPADVARAWTATMVSIALFAAATIYLYRLAAERMGRETATNAVLLVATYPFAIFYSAVYSEALFLLSVVAAWYHLERDQPLRSGGWGLVAGLSRPNGCLLALPLALSAWLHPRPRRWRRWSFLASLTPVAGMLLYSAYGYWLTGHAFVWVELQREAWFRTYQGLDQSVWIELRTLADVGLLQYISSWPFRMVNLVATLFALAAIWPVTRRLGAPSGLFVALNTLAPLLNGGLMSMARCTAVLFPVFIWLAIAARGNAFTLLAVCFGFGQAMAAVWFFTWRALF